MKSIFDQPDLARQAALALMGQNPASIEAAARGGRNTVFKATLADGSRWAIRIGREDAALEFASGLGWARALTERGVPAVIPVHLDTHGIACGHPCSISTWSDARDAEKVVASLSLDQLMVFGRAMAGWSERMLPMIKGHPATGAGLLRFGSRSASHSGWLEYLQDNFEWRMGQTLINPAWILPGDQELLHSMRDAWVTLWPSITSAPLSLLAWDIADRNVMLNAEGLPVALVDVDELMIGDPLIAPALAWAAFGFQSLPIDHVIEWEKALPWERSTLYEKRLLAYKGYWLMNFSSKIDFQSKTGLKEKGSVSNARALLLNWISATGRIVIC